MGRTNLILITGLPGTGKTTFARALSSAIGAAHLNSDMVRDKLGMRGKYDTASKKAVYDEMLRLTEKYLKKNQHTIVDATFYTKELRQPYLKLAEKCAVPARWIELKAGEKTIETRVDKKREFSEADFAVYRKIKAEYQPLEAAHLTLWSDEIPLEKMVEKAKEYLNLNTATF